MKVTDVPLQRVVTGVLMTILTGLTLFSVIEIVFEVAGLPIGQAILDVRMHKTWSPLAGV